jgi:serine protease Do
MQGPTEREACLHCAEPAALDARICPYCQMSLLVSVEATAPVSDGRRRYQVARALGRLGPPLKDLRTVQSALARGAPFAAGLTRAVAGRVLEVLAENGLEGTVTVDRQQGIPGWARSAGLGALAIAALALAGWWAFVGGRPDPPPAPPAPTTASMGAAPAAQPPSAARPVAPDSAAVIRGVLPSTVALRCGSKIGSGFFVSGELVLTNAHVLCDEIPVVVRPDGQELSGAVLQTNDRLDLALVAVVGAGATPLPLGDAGAVGSWWGARWAPSSRYTRGSSATTRRSSASPICRSTPT